MCGLHRASTAVTFSLLPGADLASQVATANNHRVLPPASFSQFNIQLTASGRLCEKTSRVHKGHG